MSELARVEAKPFAFLGVWYGGTMPLYQERRFRDIIIVSFRCRPRKTFANNVHHYNHLC